MQEGRGKCKGKRDLSIRPFGFRFPRSHQPQYRQPFNSFLSPCSQRPSSDHLRERRRQTLEPVIPGVAIVVKSTSCATPFVMRWPLGRGFPCTNEWQARRTLRTSCRLRAFDVGDSPHEPLDGIAQDT